MCFMQALNTYLVPQTHRVVWESTAAKRRTLNMRVNKSPTIMQIECHSIM